ncbi:putative membrane protein [Candidatus Methanoperedens nitroreducens]|uniref:Putative membrane protein n=1 Tax=Candidatus Methanoperedens nitratireducens TaxID=1392998 RepID=A0A062V6E2_9EURY|nr:EMC3/TMCO1 family protein [Candidatus Methanoperedens nitroreducens]KCZ72877.1 putative membrane protein [Candidatus Methanoperedens nitroreducens]MDJ1423195.1 EMC3/TMCO1 family protein [Candidatus Methanoperedens sp.]
MIKNILNRIVLYIGIFLLLGIMLFPDLRNVIGTAVGAFLNPLLSLLPLHIVIFILAAITGLYASLIQKYTMDWSLMRRVQERMKNMQKEFKQAQLANNAQKIKKLEAQRAEMMSDQMEMMKQQFKPMLYISIISIPLFFWVFTVISQDTNASMVFPFWGEQKLNDTLLGPFQYWLFWYFISSIPISQVTRKALNIGGM